MKKELKIDWRVTIPNTTEINEMNRQMKKALDLWKFIYTWSWNWDRQTTGKTWIYTLRTDGKFVGHAWSIIDYDDTKWYLAINSFGKDRWVGWYFRLPFELANRIYSKNVIIDHNDNLFSQVVVKAKAINIIKACQSYYPTTDTVSQQKTHDYCEYLRNIHKIPEGPL